MPLRFTDLKKQITPSDSKILTEAWKELLGVLAKETEEFKAQGSNVRTIIYTPTRKIKQKIELKPLLGHHRSSRKWTSLISRN